MAAFHGDHDVLLTPGLATGTAVKLGWLDMMMEDVDEYWRRVFHFSPFTVWFNLTGQPAVMLPIGESAGGLSHRGAGDRPLWRRENAVQVRRPARVRTPLVRPEARAGTRDGLIRSLPDAGSGAAGARSRPGFPDRSSVTTVTDGTLDPRRPPGARGSGIRPGRPADTILRDPGAAGRVLATAAPSRARRMRGKPHQSFFFSSPSSPAKGRWVASSEDGGGS